MKSKNEISWWDQYDEDRWKTSMLVGILVSLFAFVFLDKIHIPAVPRKTVIIEDVLFVEEPVEKKITPKKIVQTDKIPEMPPEEVTEEIVTIEIPMEPVAPNLPSNLPAAEKLQILPEMSTDITISQPTVQIAAGDLTPVTDDANIELDQGVNTDWTQENMPTIMTDMPTVNSKDNVYSGISTTITNEPTGATVHFAGVQREIKWTEILDPLLCFIESTNKDIGPVARRTLAENDKTVSTTSMRIKVDGKEFEVLLVGKKSKRQVTICMIDVKTDEFVLLIDQGLQKRSSIFKFGTVKRSSLGQIVEFKYQQKKASDELASVRMSQFWSWAKTIKCEN